MTWSYSASGSELDIARELINDVDSSNPLLSDERINKYLTGGVFAQSSVPLGAAMAAEEAAGNSVRGAKSLSAGGTSVTFRDPSDWFAIAAAIRRRFGVGVTAFAGGISQSSKDAQTDNTDLVSPAFTRRGGDPIGSPRPTQPGEPEKYGYWE